MLDRVLVLALDHHSHSVLRASFPAVHSVWWKLTALVSPFSSDTKPRMLPLPANSDDEKSLKDDSAAVLFLLLLGIRFPSLHQ